MTDRVPSKGLDAQGIATSAEIFWNLTTAPLVEHAVRRGEGLLAKDGPLVVRTGKHTGRSAKDKFTVKDALTAVLAQYVGVVREATKRAGEKQVTPEDISVVFEEHAEAINAARTALIEAMREDVGP